MEQFKHHLNYIELPAYQDSEPRPSSPGPDLQKVRWQQLHHQRRCYKPFALRAPFLLLYLCTLRACIALLELALHHTEKYTPLQLTVVTSPSPAASRLRRQTTTDSATVTSSSDVAVSSFVASTTDTPGQSSVSSPTISSSSDTSISVVQASPVSTSEWVTTITFGTDLTTTATAGTYWTEFPVTGDEVCFISMDGTSALYQCVYAATTNNLLTLASSEPFSSILMTLTTPQSMPNSPPTLTPTETSSPSVVMAFPTSAVSATTNLLTISTPQAQDKAVTTASTVASDKVTIVAVSTVTFSTPSAPKSTAASIPPNSSSKVSPSLSVHPSQSPGYVIKSNSHEGLLSSTPQSASTLVAGHSGIISTRFSAGTAAVSINTFYSSEAITSIPNTAMLTMYAPTGTPPQSAGQADTASNLEPVTATAGPTAFSAAHEGTGTTPSPSLETLYSTMTMSLPVTASSSSTTSPSELPFADPDNILTHSYSELKGSFGKADYFNALYLGPLVGVLLKMVWDVIYGDIKLMEPFYRLAHPTGASAADSILANYLQCGFNWSSLTGIFKGQWAMTLASAIYLLMSLVAPIASESMTVRPQSMCPVGSHSQPCNPAWILVRLMVRCLEVVLGLAAVLLVALMFYNLPRKSGLFKSPDSIAGLANLLNDRRTIDELRRIDPLANSKAVEAALEGDHFMLATQETMGGDIRHGIVKSQQRGVDGLTQPVSQKTSLLGNPQPIYTALSNPSNASTRPQSSPSIFQRALPFAIELLVLVFTLGLFGIVMAYYFDYKSDSFNNFFNSDTFGPRVTLSLSATLLDAHWKRMEREVRITTPWGRMASTLRRRSATAKVSVLVSMKGTPTVSFPRALKRGNHCHALVSLVANLSDINILSISAVPANGATIEPTFKAVSHISLAILGLMVLTMIFVWIWRWTNPIRRMPRTPDTIANVLLYLCGSRMILGPEDSEVRTRRHGDNKRYWFGEGVGMDGRPRWMVDWDKAVVLLEPETDIYPVYQHAEEW